MSIRFLADADLNQAIVAGSRSREPSLTFLSAKEAAVHGLQDRQVLLVAASLDCILVSHDKKTMPVNLRAHLAEGKTTPGVFLISQAIPVSTAIEALVMVWSLSNAAEWRNRLTHLPSLEVHAFR